MTLLLGWFRRHRVLTIRSGLRLFLRLNTRTNTTRFSYNDWYKKRGKVTCANIMRYYPPVDFRAFRNRNEFGGSLTKR